MQVLQDSTGLLVGGDLTGKLKVTYAGTEVVDPHLVTFRIRSIGRKDITHTSFDRDRALIFDLNSEFYGLVSITSNNKSVPNIGTAASETEHDVLILRPSHIPRGTEWTMKFIVSGPVLPTRRGLLVDTDIVDGETTSRTFLRILGSRIVISLAPSSTSTFLSIGGKK